MIVAVQADCKKRQVDVWKRGVTKDQMQATAGRGATTSSSNWMEWKADLQTQHSTTRQAYEIKGWSQLQLKCNYFRQDASCSTAHSLRNSLAMIGRGCLMHVVKHIAPLFPAVQPNGCPRGVPLVAVKGERMLWKFQLHKGISQSGISLLVCPIFLVHVYKHILWGHSQITKIQGKNTSTYFNLKYNLFSNLHGQIFWCLFMRY